MCVFLLYVGYEKAGTAEFFSTQERGEGNGAWIILSSDPLVLASERVLC